MQPIEHLLCLQIKHLRSLQTLNAPSTRLYQIITMLKVQQRVDEIILNVVFTLSLALGLNGSASLTANHTAGLMLPHDASTAGMKSHLQGGELTVAIPRVLPVDVAIE